MRQILKRFPLQERTNSRTGFTLVELLVVISIISLLASIVLGTTQAALIKDDNASRIRIVQESKKAIDLAYSTYGHYPGFESPPTLNPGTYYCFGDYSGDVCQFGPLTTGVESSLLNQALSPFIPQRPAMKTIIRTGVFFPIIRWDGPLYVCGAYLFPNCISLRIVWPMQGSDANCGFGITSTPSEIGQKSSGVDTVCTLYLR